MHLAIDADEALTSLARDRAGAKQNIGVARAGLQLDAEALEVIARGERGEDLDVASVARTAVKVQHPGRIDARPGLQPIDNGSQIVRFIHHVNSLSAQDQGQQGQRQTQ